MKQFSITPPSPPNEGIMFVDHSPQNRSGHLGHALVEYEDGKILAFYPNCSNDNNGHTGYGWMEFKRSDDGGVSWSEPEVLDYSKALFDTGTGRVAMCERACLTDNGTIVLFLLHCVLPGKASWQPLVAPGCLRSRDGGRTWSGPYQICTPPGRVYDALYDDGEILALHFANDSTLEWTGRSGEGHVYQLYASVDDGISFELRSELPFDPDGRGYGAMCLLDSGDLIAYVYTDREDAENRLEYCLSTDRGRTWSTVKTTAFAKKIRNPKLTSMDGLYFMHGRSGHNGPGSGHFVLYVSENGIDWDDGIYLRLQEAGAGAYSNSIVVGKHNAVKPNRLLVQTSHAYFKDQTNIIHYWIDVAHQ